MKYFTVEEAEALIPELEKLYGDIAEIAARAQQKAQKVNELKDDPNAVTDAAIERAQLHFLANEITVRLQKVVDLGAVPKGLEPALVDFPHRLAGRDVFLCWKLGDKRIGWYHGLEEGFSGRKALPGRA